MHADFKPGFIALHSNRLEGLAQTLSAWVERYPLKPLEVERVITLSSAVAEWYKIWMAREHGVFGVSTVDMPGRMIWGLYRSLFDAESTLMSSATDQKTLVWRLMRLLPQSLERPEFAILKDYVHHGGAKAHYELAKKIADVFDAYQIYRADWLRSWEVGERVLLSAQGKPKAFESDQVWQALLWECVVQELDAAQRQSVRSAMHQEAMKLLQGLAVAPAKWPRRLIVFGVTALPLQVLEFLGQMSKFTQVILCVHSPCQYHWADIMQGREFFYANKKRFDNRGGIDLSTTPMDQMHLHANALLAQWGRQSRDFVRQLDQFDDVQKTREDFDQLRLDLFEHETSDDVSLLHRIQNQIRDLEPAKPHDASAETSPATPVSDGSVVFHVAHNLTRELEVLHDQLLTLMASTEHRAQINPKDIVVMCPNVGESKAAIQAIFGQYAKHDARFIPFDVADTQALQTHPMVLELQWLLHLGDSRCTLSEVMDFAVSPFVAARFELERVDVEQLHEWMLDSGVRWGLSEEQRDSLGFQANGSIHTFAFGFKRMLLGLATGAMEVEQPLLEIQDIEPMTSVSGLEAQVLGRFDVLLQGLQNWWSLSQKPASATQWISRYQQLIDQFFKPTQNEEFVVLQSLSRSLITWGEALLAAEFDEVLDASVAQAAWGDHIQITPPKQRLLASGVTFCSIKSLRTLPFKVICMIGLNEGEYPIKQKVQDFDLTKDPSHQRVGDQSRAEDDRAMMLETLLAAREVLYISWSGFSPRDNSNKPASVLVTQLRQYIEAQWGEGMLQQMTTEHPMQPFNRAYFEENSPLVTHNAEWRDIHLEHPLQAPSWEDEKTSTHHISETGSSSGSKAGSKASSMAGSMAGSTRGDAARACAQLSRPWTQLETQRLVGFYKNPVKDHFVHELGVNFKTLALESEDHDHEVFRLKGLELFDVKDRLLKTFVENPDKLAHIQDHMTREIQRLKRSGLWMVGAMGELFEVQLQEDLSMVLQQFKVLRAGFEKDHGRVDDIEPLTYSVALPEVFPGCVLTGQLKWTGQFKNGLRHQLLKLQANALKGSKGRRRELMLGSWIEYLVLKTLGLDVQMCCLFTDEWFEINTTLEDRSVHSHHVDDPDDPQAQISALKAKSLLVELVQQFMRGQADVLPMPLKTALSFVGEKNPQKALDLSREVYEGGHDARFFESQEMSLARAYPEFDDLIKDPDTLMLWAKILKPFWLWVEGLTFHDYELSQEERGS